MSEQMLIAQLDACRKCLAVETAARLRVQDEARARIAELEEALSNLVGALDRCQEHVDGGEMSEPCTQGYEGCQPLTLDLLGKEARAYGMTRLSRQLGVSRESLYRGFRIGGNPSAMTALRAAEILGLKPHFDAINNRETSEK